jgi:hypothetical protein
MRLHWESRFSPLTRTLPKDYYFQEGRIMIRWKTISEADARHAIETKEFPVSVITSSPNVAVVMTQDWCSQWMAMRNSLNKTGIQDKADVDIHLFIYNRSAIFAEFLQFKETVLGNNHIPYIRYYKNGIFRMDSNYVMTFDFFQCFED